MAKSRTTTASAGNLESLRNRLEEARLQAELHETQAQVKTLDLIARHVSESVWIDRREAMVFDPQSGSPQEYWPSLADDRKNGDNWPFWRTEQELSEIRGLARYLADRDTIAKGTIEALVNFGIGTGFTYTFSAPIKKRQSTQQHNGQIDDSILALVDQCQVVLDNFFEESNFSGEMEREVFRRSVRDGEAFVRVLARDGVPCVEAIEPEHVTEPRNVRDLEDYLGMEGMDWKYGIASLPNQPHVRHGYFVSRFGDPNDWDFVPGRDMEHIRLNVDDAIKRGLSDLFCISSELQDSNKVVRNALIGASIQASIAGIRQGAPGQSASSLTSYTGTMADGTVNRQLLTGGTTSQKVEQFAPGTVKTLGAGQQWMYGPMGTPQGHQLAGVAQAGMRRAGVRWNMPEYMVSGDASNSNYASTMVAESPFVKGMLARQFVYVRAYKRLMWAVLRMASPGLYKSAKAVAITLNVQPPAVEARNSDQEELVRETRYRAGVLSARTWAEQVDLDYDHELENGAVKQSTTANLADFLPKMTEEQRIKAAADLLWEGYP